MHEVNSPLTNKAITKRLGSISTATIIEKYRQQEKADVSRFFHGLDEIEVYECNETGLRFFYPENLDGDGQFYADIYPPFEELPLEEIDAWRKEFEVALSLVRENDRVLEIGCGYGTFLERAQQKASEAYGIDLNREAVAFCRRRGLHVDNKLSHDLLPEKRNHYDFVCFFQVLEHISKPQDFLETAIELLKPNGILFIAVPNCDPYFLGYDKYDTLNMPPHHMLLWDLQSLKSLAKLFPLEYLSHYYEGNGSVIVRSFYKAKLWGGIVKSKSDYTWTDKLKTALLMPFSLLSLLPGRIKSPYHHGSIMMAYRKK